MSSLALDQAHNTSEGALLYFYNRYVPFSGFKSLESRLIEKLLVNYSADGRPVSDSSEAVSVSIGMYLSKLLDLVSMN